MRSPRIVIAAMVALAAIGCVAVWAVARAVPNAPGTGPHAAYLAVIRDAPIPVVQEATGWGVLLLVWAVLGGLAYLGSHVFRAGNGSLRLAVAAFVAVAAVLWFFPITQSIDVYYYAAYGRLYGVHGINPYDLRAPLQLGDATLAQNLQPLSNPPFADSYGPGFTLLAGIAGRLESELPLWWQVWSWRVAATLAAVAVMCALFKMMHASTIQERVERLARFAFNPLVLYEAAVGGHNDWLMVAPAVWAFALVDGTPLIAGLLAGAAISIKYMAAIVVPFLAVRAWRAKPLAGVLLVVLSIAIPLLCARPFALGQSAATTLSTVGSQLSMSLNWLLAFPFFRTGTSSQPVHAGLPLLPYLGELTWPRLIQLAIVAALAASVALSVVSYARRPDRAYVHRSVAALLWALPAMHPWYLTWLSPALGERGAWGTYASWFLALGLLVYAHEGLALTPLRQAGFICITLVMLAAPAIAARRAAHRETENHAALTAPTASR